MTKTVTKRHEAARTLAFLCHPYHRGGVTTWMVDAALEMRRRSWACWFVAPIPSPRSISGRGRRPVAEMLSAESNRPEIVAPRVGPVFELGTASHRTGTYRRAVLRGVPAGVPLVVSNDPDVWRAAAQLANRNPLIGVLHADEPPYYDLVREFGNATSVMVAVSRRIAREAADVMPGAPFELAVIPCGIQVGAPIEQAPRGGDPELLRLLWVGRVDERQKRVSDLVRVGAALGRQGIRYTLTVIGDGPDLEALKRDTAAAGLEGQILFRPWEPPANVRKLMVESDVLLLPSNFEGMPVAVMEALAAGCGVVAARVSGIEDYEDHPAAAECLWVHEVGNVAEIVKGVLAAAGVPRAVRRANAHAFARAEFDIERCMDRYVELIERLPARVGASRATVRTFRAAEWVAVPLAWLRWARARLAEQR